MIWTRLTAAVVVTVTMVASSTVAQAKRGSVAKLDVTNFDARSFDARRLIVKFAEGTGIRLRAGTLRAKADVDLDAVLELAKTATLERLFVEPDHVLDAQRAEAMQELPVGWDLPADLTLYCVWTVSTEAEGRQICAKLNALDIVETAFPDHRAGIESDPGDIPPTTPNYSSRQDYFDAPPNGIDIRRSWRIPGGRGEQLQVLDIETGLIIDHEDIPEGVAKNVIGPNPSPTDHGLAVAGEMVAGRNGYGVDGGVYMARYKFHSHQSRNWAPSVNTAATHSKRGDVIVLEVHLTHPVSLKKVPMENRQDVFDAVRVATMRGIHVVAAAGNGSQDLDAAVYKRIFDRTFRDSGSVIVGASNGATLARASFSNYGKMVDAAGWGYNVTTTGYGALFYPNRDARQKYTAAFSGTSSATPIVTSAAAAVISAASYQLGRVLKPAEARALLRVHGTAIPNGKIGPRPDLKKLLSAIGLPNGLEQTAPAKIGGAIQLEVSGTSGDLWVLYISAGSAQIATPFGRLLIDLASALPMAGGVLTGGKVAYRTAVPNDKVLQRNEFHWQALRFDALGKRLSLSTSVATFIE